MDKKIIITWFVLLVMSLTAVLIGASAAVTNIYTDTQDIKVRELKDWEITKTSEPDENGNYIISCVTKIPLIHNGGETLMFYTYHANVSAYVEGKRIYRMAVSNRRDSFPVVLGNAWNKFVITKEYEGKNLEIVLETPYSSYADYVPSFEFGNELNIVLKEMKTSAVSAVLSFGILICGIYMTIYSTVISRNRKRSYSMVYLGIFAVLMGMWFLINIPAAQFIFENGVILSYISYILFGSIAIPFILFEKQIMDKRFGMIFNIICVLEILAQVVCVGLQMTGAYNMKETLFIIHIALVAFILLFIVIAAVNIKITGVRNISRINLVNMVCAIITAAGVGIDMVRYYSDPNGGKEYICTKTALLIYIFALAYHTVKETEELMEKAKEAERFETLAYLDELTGVCNRTAYNEFVKDIHVEENSYTVFMFDLNNLKKCNDTLGHHYGDEYIKSSARFIKEAFNELGTCYRIGGDEFCIIAECADEFMIKAALEQLKNKIAVYNQEHEIPQIHIACGYAEYNRKLDENLEDTRKRADEFMYKNKADMKSKNN